MNDFQILTEKIWNNIIQNKQNIINPKIIFATSLKYNVSSFMLNHKHPSGQLIASDVDRKMTERIVSIGIILGIELLNHVIVCRSGYYSMNVEGEM